MALKSGSRFLAMISAAVSDVHTGADLAVRSRVARLQRKPGDATPGRFQGVARGSLQRIRALHMVSSTDEPFDEDIEGEPFEIRPRNTVRSPGPRQVHHGKLGRALRMDQMHNDVIARQAAAEDDRLRHRERVLRSELTIELTLKRASVRHRCPPCAPIESLKAILEGHIFSEPDAVKRLGAERPALTPMKLVHRIMPGLCDGLSGGLSGITARTPSIRIGCARISPPPPE